MTNTDKAANLKGSNTTPHSTHNPMKTTMNNYTVTAGQAMTQVEAETPEQAAELASDELKEILAAHLTPGTPEYPVEMNVQDNATGKDFGFTL